MRDEFYDRLYQAHRHDLHDGIEALVKSVAHAFRRLNARVYDAPWLQATRASGAPRRGDTAVR